MKLKVKKSKINAATKTICIIHEDDAKKLGVIPLNRIILNYDRKETAAVVNTSTSLVHSGEIIIDSELANILRVNTGDNIKAEPREMLISKEAIRKKIHNKHISFSEAQELIHDVEKHKLNDLEISSFLTAATINGLTDKEIYYFTKAMIETGAHLDFGNNSVDKHSIGGVPGDKTTLLLVPIIAASGIRIPKTSSRAITNPAGTADRMEVLAPVKKTKNQIKKIIKDTGGCIVWGGSFNLAPADDEFIEIERPLNQDSMLLPSVLSKKKVVGSRYVIIDIPVGPEAKVKTKKEGQELGLKFRRIGKMLGMKIDYVLTNGIQPIGHALGPALEAREALEILMKRKNHYLIKKTVELAATMFLIKKKVRTLKQGRALALSIIKSGAAEKKLREIIKAQGGNPNIMPDKIKIGKFHKNVLAPKSGKVKYISVHAIQRIARLAGSPQNKKSGIFLNKKLNEKVKKGEVLYTVYAEHKNKLKNAIKFSKKNNAFIIK